MAKEANLHIIFNAALIICCRLTDFSVSCECKFVAFENLDSFSDSELLNKQRDENNWTINDSIHYLLKDNRQKKIKAYEEYCDSNIFQQEKTQECILFKKTENIWVCWLTWKNSSSFCNGICDEGSRITKKSNLPGEELIDLEGNGKILVLVIGFLQIIFVLTPYLRYYFSKSNLHKEQNETKRNQMQKTKQRNVPRSRGHHFRSKKILKSRKSPSFTREKTYENERAMKEDNVSVNEEASVDSGISITSEQPSSSTFQKQVSEDELCTSVSPYKFPSSNCNKVVNEVVNAGSNINISRRQPSGTIFQKQVSKNELCISETYAKQYMFSSTLRCSRHGNRISSVNDFESSNCPLNGVTSRKQTFGPDRSFPVFSSLNVANEAEEVNSFEETPPLKLLSDLDEDQTLLNLKLPDPFIFKSEDTSAKGHLRITNNLHDFQLTLSTDYPFISSNRYSRKSYGEIESFSEDDLRKDDDCNLNESGFKSEENTCKLELDRKTVVQTNKEFKFDLDTKVTDRLEEESKSKIASEDKENAIDEPIQKSKSQDEAESSDLSYFGLHNYIKKSQCDESLYDSDFNDEQLFEIDCLDIRIKLVNDKCVSIDHNDDVFEYLYDSLCQEDQIGETSPVSSMEGISESPQKKSQSMNHQKKKTEAIRKRNIITEDKRLLPNCRQIGNVEHVVEPVLLSIQDSLYNLKLSVDDQEHVIVSPSNIRPLEEICTRTEEISLCYITEEICSSINGEGKSSLCGKFIDSKMNGKRQNRCSEIGSLNHRANFSRKKDESKKKKLTKTISGVYQDSGFSSGSCKLNTTIETEKQTLVKNSPIELLHACLKRDIMLQTMSRDFFQNLKILKNVFEDEEQRHILKQSSREFHFTYQSIQTVFPGLGSYFDRLNNGPPLTTPEQMQYEWLRLSSYHNYSGNGNALALARNGFYHDHNDGPNSTRCYLCEAQYANWEMFDDIPEQHRRLSPNCPFHDNQENESLNVSITYGEVSGQVTTSSSASSTPGSVVSTNLSSSNASAAVSEVASNLQRTSISQARVGNSGGESISQQPTEDLGSDRSMLALTQPRALRALGRTGSSYASIMAPARNNVASGARSNEGVNQGPDVARSTSGQIPGIRPSSILGGPVGAGAFAGPSTGVARAKENLQQSNAPTLTVEATSGTQQSNPAAGGGGRTDPTITVLVDNPKHPDYLNIDRRVNSYQGWPEYLDQTPRQMAEAGFFFVGVADFTRCFCCGGGLRNWEPGDDPILEHTRWFPRCEYINKLKGERYVAAVQRRHEEHIAEQQRQQNELAQRRDESRNQSDPLTMPAALTLIEMGYSSERTRAAVTAVRQQTGQSVPSIEQVLTYLLDNEDRGSGTGLSTELGIRPQPTVPSSVASTVTGTSIPSNVTTGISAPTTIVGTSISSNFNIGISTPTTLLDTSIPSSILNAAANIPTTLLDTSIPSSIFLTAFSVPSSVDVSTSIIGTPNVNVVSSTSQIGAGTTTSTVSSTSTAATPMVQPSASASASTEGSISGSSSSGSTSTPSVAMGTSTEKQPSATGGSDESKEAGKDASSSSEPVSKSSKKKNGKKKGRIKGKSETAGAAGGDIDAKSLKAENEKLKEMQTCKICMERTVNTTLLPCGHLVCCETCAGRLQRCPICRKKIKGTVKTFMS